MTYSKISSTNRREFFLQLSEVFDENGSALENDERAEAFVLRLSHAFGNGEINESDYAWLLREFEMHRTAFLPRVFINVDIAEAKKPTGFYDRRVMLAGEASLLNLNLTNGTVWVLQPTY